MKSFEELAQDSQSNIREMLKDINQMPSYMLEKQLKFILEELEQMAIVKDANIFYPYFSKGIEDSWPTKDGLSIQLLEVLEAYTSL